MESVRIADALQRLRAQIAEAEVRYGRTPGSVQLLAVSKTRDAETVAQAVAAGQHAFGENYLQEAKAKITALRDDAVHWHFIGAVQSNKTRDIAALFDWVHGVDRLSIARRLGVQRPGNRPNLNVCIQVNPDGEAGKSGVMPEQARALAEDMAALPGLELRGLMAIPAPRTGFLQQRKAFAGLRKLFEELAPVTDTFDTLSIGMSGDFEAAIAEGATIVRIGRAIFGARK